MPSQEGEDPIAAAFRRERERARIIGAPECESAAEHLFRCVCCGKVRGDHERREPASEVCARCVAEAGYWN